MHIYHFYPIFKSPSNSIPCIIIDYGFRYTRAIHSCIFVGRMVWGVNTFILFFIESFSTLLRSSRKMSFLSIVRYTVLYSIASIHRGPLVRPSNDHAACDNGLSKTFIVYFYFILSVCVSGLLCH